MDPLEKRIRNLQPDLQQVEQPDRALIWQGVALPPRSPKKPSRWVWVAAAGLLLLLGIGLGYWWSKNPAQPIEDVKYADLQPELAAEVQQYQQLVINREQAVHINAPKGALAMDEFRELYLLDSLHQEFLKDFPSMPKDDKSAQRYLHYYEQKIRILELILKETQIKKHEKERIIQ